MVCDLSKSECVCVCVFDRERIKTIITEHQLSARHCQVLY